MTGNHLWAAGSHPWLRWLELILGGLEDNLGWLEFILKVILGWLEVILGWLKIIVGNLEIIFECGICGAGRGLDGGDYFTATRRFSVIQRLVAIMWAVVWYSESSL